MELLDKLSTTPIPTILVVLGTLVVLAALVGKGRFWFDFDVPKGRTGLVVCFGVVLLLSGVGLFVLPAVMQSSPSSSHAQTRFDGDGGPGPRPVPTPTGSFTQGKLEARLHDANILLAGGPPARVEEMRGFLQTDPALQTLAESCLKLLANRRFCNPLHLDVINGHYKRLVDPTADYLSPERYGDTEKLQTAILLHWREKYPQPSVNSLSDIVE